MTTLESAARRLVREIVNPEREKVATLAKALRAFLESHHFACACTLCNDARDALNAAAPQEPKP